MTENRAVRNILIASVFLLSNSGLVLADLKSEFKEPPSEYRSMPFWHINGTLTTEKIKAQMKDSRDKSGFGGVAVLPVGGMKPDYLSDEYFARYKDILTEAKDLGMQVIFYDDIDFPSGSAGGKMQKLYPDDTIKRLDKAEEEVDGPKAYERTLPQGDFMAAVAMNTNTKQRIDITKSVKEGKLSWNVPAGRWKIMVFTCVHKERHLVDFLSPESVDKFFSLTYEEYYKRFKEHFGTTIKMSFFDDVGFFATVRPWTTAFNEKFKKKNGFDPAPYYPALWYDIGPETEAARVALFGFRAELMAEGYPRKAGEWARKHGIQSSGHPPGNYDPTPVDMSCDIYKFYRHCDIPLMDAIFFHGHGRPGFKLISSAADVYDRPVVAAEVYGAFSEQSTDVNMLYRAGMEMLARGVNFVIPHGMWYNPKNVRIPPLISHFSDKLASALPDYNRYVARSCLLLRGGRHVADIAMFYPIASLEAWYYYPPPANVGWGQFVPPEADYQKVSDMLTSHVRRDFTFLHPDALDEKCQIKGATLHLDNKNNFQDYNVLVMPGGKVIEWSALQKIKKFYDNGGKVVATTQLPYKSAEFGHDSDVKDVIQSMFNVTPADISAENRYKTNSNANGGKSYFTSMPTVGTLQAILDDALPVGDVRFENNPRITSGNGVLSYLHKVKDGRDIYFFANSSDDRVDTCVKLRGNILPEVWDPHTGNISKAEYSHVAEAGQDVTQVRLQLEPVKSVFIVGAGKE